MKGLAMARPSKWHDIEEERGNLQTQIPKLLNEHQSQKTVADLLGVSPATLHVWLKDNNFVRKMQWVQE